MADAAHTEKQKGGCTPLKVCGSICCFVLLVVGALVGILLGVTLPGFQDSLLSEMSFYPCSITYCLTNLTDGVCPTGMTCEMGAPSPTGVFPSCGAAIRSAAINNKFLTATVTMRFYNGGTGALFLSDGMDVPIKQLSLSAHNPLVPGFKLAEAAVVPPSVYRAAGNLLACNMVGGPVSLKALSWTTMTLACEFGVTPAADGLISTFSNPAYPENLTLPTNFSFGVTVEGPFGDTIVEDIYEAGDSTDNIADESGCPALDDVSTALASVPSGAPFWGPHASHQCGSVLGPGMLGLDFGKCAPTETAVQTGTTTAFLCCLAKTIDALGELMPIFLNFLSPTSIAGQYAPLLQAQIDYTIANGAPPPTVGPPQPNPFSLMTGDAALSPATVSAVWAAFPLSMVIGLFTIQALSPGDSTAVPPVPPGPVEVLGLIQMANYPAATIAMIFGGMAQNAQTATAFAVYQNFVFQEPFATLAGLQAGTPFSMIPLFGIAEAFAGIAAAAGGR